jgi:hypothetical protein
LNVLVGDIHRVRTGVGINSLDCVNAEGRWISRSFLGGARRLELRGRIANVLSEELRYGELDLPCSEAGTGPFGTLNGSVNVDFVQPWFLGPRNALGVGLGFERRSVPGVFVRDSRGGYVAFTHQLSPRTSGTLAYRPALTSFVEDAGGDLRIVVERFVEIPHAKEEDGIVILFLDLPVLGHQRGCIAHGFAGMGMMVCGSPSVFDISAPAATAASRVA